MDVVLSQVFTGISIGSVLLLAALGLMLTFGQMGVINMAHGEFMMAGAYTAYMVQRGFPDEISLLVSIPIGFVVGGLMGLLGKGSGSTGSKGYQGAIPKYTAVRGPSVSPTAGGRRPGGAGIGSLAGTTKYVPAATGGLMDMAEGGRPARYLRGGTDGMADKIETDIDGKQPARLSHGEFVIPADVVSHLGNGNSDAGADVLYEMMDKVRTARTGTKKQGKQINPRKYIPA